MMGGAQDIFHSLRAYKKKFYLNQLIKGLLISGSVIISYYLLINGIDYFFKLDSTGRSILFFSFLILFLLSIVRLVLLPASKLANSKSQISDEEAAYQIGQFFPEISDKLLNTIQLQKNNKVSSDLLTASINQRTQELSIFSFPSAIDLNVNRKYLKYLLPPIVVLLILIVVLPQVITESTGRIVQFQTEFIPEAPFQFSLENESLTAFRNEDFTLEVAAKGEVIPQEAFLVSNGRRIKLSTTGLGTYEYTFNKIQEPVNFYLEASGFASEQYEIELYNRPNLRNYNVLLDYPNYTGRQNENLKNAGNLEIPEGTRVTWQFGTLNTEILSLSFVEEDLSLEAEAIDNQVYKVEKQIFSDDFYTVQLKNENAQNKENIGFSIKVIEDEYPQISLEPFQDTTLYSYVILGGNIEDDYGINQLALRYKKDKQEDFETFLMPFNRNQKTQSYFYNWKLDTFALAEGESMEYYVQVWDNDAINGNKSTKTGTYTFKVPSRKEIKEKLEKESESAENQINESVDKAEELRNQIEEIEDKLKSKKQLDWQDEKRIEELLKKRESLEEEIQKLQQQNKDFFEKQNRFNEQSEEFKNKVKKLQELMNELLDEETKQLYEELKKLLEENSSVEEVQDMMEKLDNNEENMEKELERALELFKRMKMDYKLEEILQDLEQTQKEQEQLAEDTESKSMSEEELQQKQDELKEDFEEIQESIDEFNEMNEELENPNSVEDTEQEEEEIKKEMDQSSENLQNNKKKKAAENQKNAADKMKKLQQKMQMMQQSMEMTMMQENLDQLRDILDNLVKLSFDQEAIMDEFKRVNQSDPRFVTLSQEQLQMKDDAQIIEDSLLALADRVFQIASFVTREVDAMNDNMDESIEALRERNKALAVSKQQFTMTSMNNLALLLNDVMQQMQQAMADAQGISKGNEKGKKQQMPGLSELQNELNNKIEQLKKEGKSGRQLSEELAKMAAQQEKIRRELEQMRQMMEDGEGGGAGGNIEELLKKMEETETDLVNKRLTEEMRRRQEDILTRLLKAEDAMRERELDDEREGEQAKEYAREMPPAYEEYIKAKEKEIELLKTIPLQLNPYYKREVNEYFKRLGKQ